MKLRKPTPSDLAFLAEWNHQLIRDEGHRNPMTVPQLKKRMSSWLKKKEYWVLLFEEAGSPLGYVLYTKEKDQTYIRHFFIERKNRRRGLGKKAMGLLLKKEWPKGRVVLDVLVHNQRAAAFWKSLGFKPYCLTLEKRTSRS